MATDSHVAASKSSRTAVSGLCFGNTKSTTDEMRLRQQVADDEAEEENQRRQITSSKPEKLSFTRKAGRAIGFKLKQHEKDASLSATSLRTYQLGAIAAETKLSLDDFAGWKTSTPPPGHRVEWFQRSDSINIGKIEVLDEEETKFCERRGSGAAEFREVQDATFIERRQQLKHEPVPQKDLNPGPPISFTNIRVPILSRGLSQRDNAGQPETRSRWGQRESSRSLVRRNFSRTRWHRSAEVDCGDVIEPQQVISPPQSLPPLETTHPKGKTSGPTKTCIQSQPAPRYAPPSQQQSKQKPQGTGVTLRSKQHSTGAYDSVLSVLIEPQSQLNGAVPSTYDSGTSHQSSVEKTSGQAQQVLSKVSTVSPHTKKARKLPGSVPSSQNCGTRLSSRDAAPVSFRTSQSSSWPDPSSYRPLSPYDSELQGRSSLAINRQGLGASGLKAPRRPPEIHPALRPARIGAVATGYPQLTHTGPVSRGHTGVTGTLLHEAPIAEGSGSSRHSLHSSSSGYTAPGPSIPVRISSTRPESRTSRRPQPEGDSVSGDGAPP